MYDTLKAIIDRLATHTRPQHFLSFFLVKCSLPENFQREKFSGLVLTESLRTQDSENVFGLGDQASVLKLWIIIQTFWSKLVPLAETLSYYNVHVKSKTVCSQTRGKHVVVFHMRICGCG